MTREAQCYVSRQLWLAVRLAAGDDKTEPEAIVEAALTEYLASKHPDAMARALAYLEAKSAAWKVAATRAALD